MKVGRGGKASERALPITTTKNSSTLVWVKSSGTYTLILYFKTFLSSHMNSFFIFAAAIIIIIIIIIINYI